MPHAQTEADRQRFRAVMGHFATGVAVVTGLGREGAVGMTTNALCSLSLDPLLVLVCFDNTARTLPVVRESGRFGVNVLRVGQDGVSGQFASKLPLDRKFDAVDYTLEHGVPVLGDVLAWLVCEVREVLAGGDHTIGVGAVVAMGHDGGDPLVWYRGTYTTVSLPPVAG
ncbi:MAG: flavin reductase family protein [Actinomycetota bacterium]|nr:flavin reductase family protein [Actinomycetota bacterium]